MSLIDQFNIFQAVSKNLGLSANARSLYIAILGEFNGARYPEALKLSNSLLQDISGINSESSFHSARNALMNAKLVQHKKQVYKLTPNDAQSKMTQSLASVLERPCNLVESGLEPACNSVEGNVKLACSSVGTCLEFSDTVTYTTLIPRSRQDKEEKEKLKTNNTNDSARTRELTACSEKAAQAWFMAEGRYPHGYDDHNLAYFEQEHGTEKVVEAIRKAQASNTENKLSTNYIKAILERGTRNGRNDGTVDNSQYAGVDTF